MTKTIVRTLGLALFAALIAAPAWASALVCVDVPARNATVPSRFGIGGWALDTDATTSDGISVLHVWAYPAGGAPPVFVSVVNVGVSRPDVASMFGGQYARSGFGTAVSYPLAPGSYTLAVFPFSSVLNAFDVRGLVLVPIRVVAATPPPAPAPSSGTQLRVLQWNTHHGGYGTDGVYSPDRIATWAASMKPDVVMFNEIERNDYWGHQDQPEVYKNLLQQKTGQAWYYVFAQEFGDWGSSGKGNLILSRYPITTSARYELTRTYDRSIAMAAISVNGHPVTLVSTHLDPYDPSLRLSQATEVTNWASVQPESRILAGDMNAWPDQSSIGQITKTYNDAWAVAVSKGTATAFPGNNGETRSGRIDYIFYSKGGSLSLAAARVYDTRDANGVMPSDHRPVLATFDVK